MEKVFLESLPRRGKYIDWNKSIGYKIKFVYGEIEGEVPVLDIIQKINKNNKIRYYIITEYGANINFCMTMDAFCSCKFKKLLGKDSGIYKYKIGDIIEDANCGILKILEPTRRKYNKNTYKAYKYQCLICGNVDIITEINLKNGHGCNVCCSKKILKGYNDLWTTHPNIARMLKNKEIGYTTSHGSSKKQIFICPDCGHEKKLIPYAITVNGFGCPKCGDGISFPEKFTFAILEQLKVKFLTQLTKTTFEWCKGYRYDFYLNNYNIILEVNGLQHYKDTYYYKRTLEEEEENDKNKKELAIKNGIKEDNYIVIDCRKSELEWIKYNILSSELSNIYDISNIDWIKCLKYAYNSLVKEVCKLWREGIKNINEISIIYKLSTVTIRNYLKKGSKLGWCKYK